MKLADQILHQLNEILDVEFILKNYGWIQKKKSANLITYVHNDFPNHKMVVNKTGSFTSHMDTSPKKQLKTMGSTTIATPHNLDLEKYLKNLHTKGE